MKQIILIRHAKSDWPENTDDFDRPLADKGCEDASKMSAYLKKNDITIDQFVSSPAVRAFDTCKIFNETYQLPFEINEKLYNPSEKNFHSVIYGLNEQVNTVAFFSHNNGISNFANSITEDVFHFPTCGVACFRIDCNSWSEFDGAKKKLMFFYDPKKI